MKKSTTIQRLIFVILICLAAPLATPCAAVAAANTTSVHAPRHGVVSWVYDGDTLQVKGIGVVRLVGIDCPEKVDSDRDWKFMKMGCPDRATLRTNTKDTLRKVIRLCKGKQVQLQQGSDNTDRYGRMLAYVWLPDGRMLNRLLLRQGRAIVYRRFNFRYKKEFIELEQKAITHRRGIWKNLNKNKYKHWMERHNLWQ